MTREQIERMESSDEMDVLVAQSLGWKLLDYEDDSEADPHRVDWRSDGYRWNGWDGDDGEGEAWEFNPSDDIAVAWDVVEAFGPAFVQLTHGYGEPNGERVDGWWCEIIASAREARAFAETAPLAICRAALLAALASATAGGAGGEVGNG